MSIIGLISFIICAILFAIAFDTVTTKAEQERDGYAKYTYDKEDTDDHDQNDKG